MGRGEYRTSYTNGRGCYGSPWSPPPIVARELSDEEVRKATEAGNRAAQPLIDAHNQMMRGWPASKPLTRDQMTTIMTEALKVARETEKQLVTMIDKVPKHWETMLRRDGGLKHLRQGIDEAPKFQGLVDKVTSPTVIPDFRLWIDHLFGRSESAVIAMGAAGDILPDWLRMRAILSRIHGGAVAAINGILALGEAAVKVVTGLPSFVKIAGIAVLGLGGVWAVSKLATTKRRSGRALAESR
jgi:hypothetical protein